MSKLKFEMTGYIFLDELLIKIKNGADINIKNNDGDSALILASYSGNIDICKLLLKNKANINIQNKIGYTVLMYATSNGYITICKLLIEKGADLYIKNNNGRTAIDIMKDRGIYEELKPIINRMEGIKYFREVFVEHAEAYMDIFETTLYSQEIGLDEIKANINMFYSTIIAKMENNDINEDTEL